MTKAILHLEAVVAEVESSHFTLQKDLSGWNRLPIKAQREETGVSQEITDWLSSTVGWMVATPFEFCMKASKLLSSETQKAWYLIYNRGLKRGILSDGQEPEVVILSI